MKVENKTTENRFWVYEKLQKVFVEFGTSYEEEVKMSNKDKAVDYEMESVLAGFATDNFNEDAYDRLKWEQSLDLK